MNKWILRRRILQFKLIVSKVLGKGGETRSELLRKSRLFYKFGQGGAWHPGTVPSEPWLMKIGNNVVVAADVKFFTHDVCHSALNACFEVPVVPLLDTISIGDNVVIGANSIILPGVTIGDNVIIGAGSIVTKNVESFSVVAGNPAKKIGDFESLYHKRVQEKKNLTEHYDANEMMQYYWK